MRLSNEPLDPQREATYQAEIAKIAMRWTPAQLEAHAHRLARYRRNRINAEAEYYREQRGREVKP